MKLNNYFEGGPTTTYLPSIRALFLLASQASKWLPNITSLAPRRSVNVDFWQKNREMA